jgi:O-acetyl-ADP-ribose deacetylase (regulator of RNase III)
LRGCGSKSRVGEGPEAPHGKPPNSASENEIYPQHFTRSRDLPELCRKKSISKMAKIHYLKGDATAPQAAGNKIIAHICNDAGGWGRGFVLAISKRWTTPEESFRDWYRNRAQNDFALGSIQIVQVGSFLHIANMIGQHGIVHTSSGPPIRYEALRSCLEKLQVAARELRASVHMPRIGAGLAGGNWDLVESIILETLIAGGVTVYVYDFE